MQLFSICVISRLLNLNQVMSQVEGQQKNLVNSIESLPSRGPLSSLDQDLLLLKATSAATLSCLGECLSILQHNVCQAAQHLSHSHTQQDSSENSWARPKSTPEEQMKNGDLTQHNTSPRHQSFSPVYVRQKQFHPSSVGQKEREMEREKGRVQWEGAVLHGFRDSWPIPLWLMRDLPRGLIRRGIAEAGNEDELAFAGAQYSLFITSAGKEMMDVLQENLIKSSHNGKANGMCPKWRNEPLDSSEETTDTEDNEEEELGVLDEQRSVILHLLSQLKLGMDLTRVVLPTFILEKRSLLEMYANFMAHPDLFLAIPSGATPEERMIRFVEYYLTAFHEGRKGAVAKKPYNPILGESFHCAWDVPQDRVRPLRTSSSSSSPAHSETLSGQSASSEGDGGYRLRFVAEQVSHHPPVSGFYCECRERRIAVNTHVWTKSKFMGMSIGVSMVGEGVLHLLDHDEQYVFTLPSAFARSILTVPWVELGGKVSICCARTGYCATVTFHTKPFYGGKVHRVTAEVKHGVSGTVVCKAQGEWNGILEFTYSTGESKVIDTSRLPIIRKKIRPLHKQGPYESRRLWQQVTAALKGGDIDAATEHKQILEEKQRRESKQRAASGTSWKPQYFVQEVTHHFLFLLVRDGSTKILYGKPSEQGVTILVHLCLVSLVGRIAPMRSCQASRTP
ncbi:hypothetical protein DNTS_000351 [Danionella cerebrum]|uniref:Oxysterol-binding protein n=1 Tax=Danionella cerebrum TaxID=2873325 RepID=A0A553R5T6_9TELE|nr:hypothetical protein DNTS_000351 [Danionella translucida]